MISVLTGRPVNGANIGGIVVVVVVDSTVVAGATVSGTSLVLEAPPLQAARATTASSPLANATRRWAINIASSLFLDFSQQRDAVCKRGMGIEEFMEKPQPTCVIHPRQRLLNPHMGCGH